MDRHIFLSTLFGKENRKEVRGMSEQERKRRNTLCWRCGKAVGHCSWSGSGEPVKDWDAEQSVIVNEDGTSMGSYHVRGCPEFIEG